MSIQRIRPGARFAAAVVHQGVVHLSGQVARDTSEDAGGQTRQVLATIDRLLAEAGTDKTHILQATVYLADMADFAAMNAVWDAWVVQDCLPTRATVEARLATPAHRVEIVVIAAQAD